MGAGINRSGGPTQVPNDILARDKSAVVAANPLGSLPRVLDIPLPWLEPMPSSQALNVVGKASTVGVETGTEIVDCTFKLGRGVIGVIRSFTVYITDMVPTTDVRFGLFIAGGPAPGFGRISMFPRTASSVSNTFDALLILPPEATIQCFFANVDGGVYQVGASYSGWMHTEAAAKNWIARGPDSY